MLKDLSEKVFFSDQISKDQNTMNYYGILNRKECVSYGLLKNHLVDRHKNMWEILKSEQVVVQKAAADTAMPK